MKLRCVKFASLTRYCSKFKCNLQPRFYCSKSEDNFTKSASEKNEKTKEQSTDSAVGREKFEYPDPKITPEDYMKPMSQYIVEDFKNNFSIMNFRKTRDETYEKQIPQEVEFLVIGAGSIGSSIGYWLKRQLCRTLSVLVIDKNLSISEPSEDSEDMKFALLSSVCSLKQQYELKENVELSQFGAEFLRNMEMYTSNAVEFPDIPFQPFGYLKLVDKNSAGLLKKIHSKSLEWKSHHELLTPYQLSQRYPWLHTDDVELATHGLKNEGWFDPHMFLMKTRVFASHFGAEFRDAEVLEFVYKAVGHEQISVEFPGFISGEYKPCNYVYLKLKNGDIRKIQFAYCIIALDAGVGPFCKDMLHLDKKYSGMHQFELPIISRKHRIYCFAGPEGGPGISSPCIIDSTGLVIKRYGPLNEYICTCPPVLGNDSDEELSNVDYFEKIVWPLLAARIPLFENLRLKSSVSYYEDFNNFDGGPILSSHPAYHNFLFISGFGDRCHQHAPGIGRAVMEIMVKGNFQTIDLTRFGLNRIIQEVPLVDSCII